MTDRAPDGLQGQVHGPVDRGFQSRLAIDQAKPAQPDVARHRPYPAQPVRSDCLEVSAANAPLLPKATTPAAARLRSLSPLRFASFTELSNACSMGSPSIHRAKSRSIAMPAARIAAKSRAMVMCETSMPCSFFRRSVMSRTDAGELIHCANIRRRRSRSKERVRDAVTV